MTNQLDDFVKMLTDNSIKFKKNDKGTIIKIFDTNKKNPICQVECGAFSWGGAMGLLELTWLGPEKDNQLIGFLTSTEAFNLIQDRRRAIIE